MKCVIEGSNVKVFGKAIHALSRISDEMWLDPLETGLAVRSVGPAHSSYGCFLFSRLFFQLYSLNTSSPQAALGRCKLAVKSVLPLFRCPASIERSVDSCKISTSLSDTQVTFQLFCKHGITKTYNLGFQERDVLQAVFPAHLCPNVLKAQPSATWCTTDRAGHGILHRPLLVILTGVTSTLCESKITADQMKVMSTEMSLHPEEFDYFHVGVNSDITFCLKELRKLSETCIKQHAFPLLFAIFNVWDCTTSSKMGLLSFAESHGLPVYVHFGHPGQPVRFSVENMVLEASVVLATQTDSESEVPVQPGGSEDPAALSHPQDAPPTAPPEEHVPSSQGSPVLSRPRTLAYIGLHVATDSGAHAADPEPADPEPADPATFRLHSLLFGAVSGPWPNEGAELHTSLARASDTEEDNMEERSSATPMPVY